MIKIFSAILAILIIPITCLAKVSHPPTYEEMQKCYQSDECCEDLEEAKEYTSQEVDQLYQAGDYRFEISLAIKSFYDGDIRPLWEATKKYRNMPEVHAAFVTNILSDYSSDDEIREEITSFSSIKDHIITFKNVDPDNSLPDYLQAYYHFINNSSSEAIRSLKQAEKKLFFKIYTRKFIEHSVAASEFVQYPRFLAMEIGLETAITGVRPYIYKKLGDQIETKLKKLESVRSLEILGKRLKKSSVMMITRLMAYKILFNASFSDSEKAKDYRAKSKEIFSLSVQFKENSVALTEKQLVQFYETMLSTDEFSAMKKVMKNKSSK